jgi:glycosyltransferase involved in cell wall biosynthesis
MNINEYDVVHTIASPFSTHLIPLYFVKRLNTLFVAQFYDPWVDNSYINLRFKFFKKLNLRLEKLVAEKADLVIHTNSIIVNKWEKRYGVNALIKNLVLPLCMENNMVNKVKSISLSKKNSEIIISHVGSIYGKRNLNTLIKALQFIFDTQKNILNDLTINLVGTIEASELKKLKVLKFKEIFNLKGNVSHEESLTFMSQASWLLLLEEEGEEGLFFPSKLTDYLAVYKPIIGIIPKNCFSREILSENGHRCFDHGEVENIANFIIGLSKRNEMEINNKISKLEVKNVVSIYEHSIEKLMDKFDVLPQNEVRNTKTLR